MVAGEGGGGPPVQDMREFVDQDLGRVVPAEILVDLDPKAPSVEVESLGIPESIESPDTLDVDVEVMRQGGRGQDVSDDAVPLSSGAPPGHQPTPLSCSMPTMFLLTLPHRR